MESASRKQLRSFGFLVGGVFLLIGCAPWILRHQPVRLWSLVLGSCLVLLGLLLPHTLRSVYRLWMYCGERLGWLNTRIILGLLFYIVVLPIAIIMRLSGKDLMGRQFDPTLRTYRVVKSPRPASHMEHQF